MTPFRDPLQQAADLISERVGEADGAKSVTIVDLAMTDPDSLIDVVSSTYVALITDTRGSTGPYIESALSGHLREAGVTPEFTGQFRTEDLGIVPLAICRGVTPPPIVTAPDSFKVVAIVAAYNEEDVIEAMISHLVANGVGVFLLDNWSTDETLRRALAFEHQGLIGWERFPMETQPTRFELSMLMRRVEELAKSLDAHWIISHDADELRSSPWPGVSMRDALYHVQREGFSAVNYTALTFPLTADTYRYGSDLPQHFEWFRLDPAGAFQHLKTWQRQEGVGAELAWSGGHRVQFPGIKVFPYNFLLRHYPIRSVEHGRRKVFKERLPRFPVGERLQGWHSHYDRMKADDLVQPTTGLHHYGAKFADEYLLERIAGPLPQEAVAEAGLSTAALKRKLLRMLRRAGLLEKVLRFRWRISGRAAK